MVYGKSEISEDKPRVSPEDITCTGYIEDIQLLRYIARPEVYEQLLDALELEFDEIPKLRFIGCQKEDIEITEDENGRQIVNVYVYSQAADKLSVSTYISTALDTAIIGLLLAKFPNLSGTVFPMMMAGVITGGTDYLVEFGKKLIAKYTMKGLLKKFTSIDLEQFYKDAKEAEIDEIESPDDFLTSPQNFTAEATAITADSLTRAFQHRGSTKTKIALGKIRNQSSKLVDSIKDSISVETDPKKFEKREPVKANNTPEDPTMGDESEDQITESMLHSLAEGSYIIHGDYVTIFEDASNDTQLKRILYKERMVKRKDVLAILDRVKADVPEIKYAYPDIDRYQTRNLWVDLYYYNEAFFKNNDWKMQRGFNLYKDFLDRLINDKRLTKAGYKRRTVFIPINDWNIDPNKRMWMYREGINPISIIYELMRSNPNELKKLFKGVNVVFFGKDKYFTVDFNDTANYKKNCMKFKNFIIKINNGEEFDADDTDGSEDKQTKESIKTDIIDSIDVSKGVDLTATAAKSKSTSSTTTKVSDPIKKSTIYASADKKTDTKPKEEDEVEDTPTISKATANKSVATDTTKTDEEILKRVVDKIDDVADNSVDLDDALDQLDTDDDLKDILIGLDSMKDDAVNINAARANRMSELDRNLLDQSIKGRSIREIIGNDKSEKSEAVDLPKTDLKIASPNKEWSELSYINFDDSYDMEKDIVNAFRHFSNVSRPLAIRNIKVEDNSTSEDYLDLYTVEYEDYRGKRFTVKLDIPKIKNNRFILRGNAKMIQSQFFNMPIIKTNTDACQIVSNYKKIIMRRYNTSSGKSIDSAAKIMKVAKKYTGTKIKFVPGDNSLVCNKYVLPIDYIDLATNYNKIEMKDYTIFFNQDELRKEYDIKEGLGVPFLLDKKNKLIRYYPDNEKTPFSYFILEYLFMTDKSFAELYDKATSPSKGTYVRAKIMGSEIPLVVVCSYHEGLSKVLKKANIQYRLINKLDIDTRHSNGVDWIRFNDGYLVFNIDYNSSLLLNGLKDCDTLSHSITEIDDKNMYLEFLDNFGGRIKADGLDNFYDCEIDPITKETLEFYHLPTDYISALLYANYLLSDNKFIRHTDTSSRRARRFELVAAYTYQVLAEAYGNYANSLKHNRTQSTMSCKQSAVIDKILSDPTSSDYSVISAINDIESSNAITTKGLSGLNDDRSYSLDKRTYDDSMLGVVGMSTGFSGNVGITRQATIDSAVQGNRGYVKDNKGKVDNLNSANALTATESIVPFATTHDDPMRVAMTFIQTSKHSMRTLESDPLLVTSGSDEAIPYICSDQFAYKAKGKGVIKELDEEKMIIEYEDGNKDYVDLSQTIQKNSDGGFYVTLKLDVADKLKVGSKVSPNQILAYDKSSMSNSLGESDNLAYNVGKLSKIAIINTDEGFEDAGIITEEMAKKLACKVTVKDQCILEKNTNIYNVAKVGSHVEQGDPLIIWQTPYEEEEVNALLKALANDKDAVSELGRHTVHAEVTGTLIGMKVYRTVELDELSDSLKTLVKKYEKPISDLKKHLKEEGIDTATLPANYPLEATGKLKNAGDGVLIEFYIEYVDTVGIGDKITYNAANKAVIKNIIPEGKEPYTDFRPEEHIDAFVSTISIDKRLVTSTLLYGSLQKLMIELDRSCKDLAGIEWDHTRV